MSDDELHEHSQDLMRDARALLMGMPLVLLGLILCATVVWFPVGIVLMFLGCRPFYKSHKVIMDKRIGLYAPMHKVRHLHVVEEEEQEVPWELPPNE